MFFEKSLEGKIALVTGGGRGIGRSISEDLAQLGAKVYINYSRSSQEAESLVAELVSKGLQAEAIKFDVSSEEDVEAGVKSIVEKDGAIHILVNNAGVAIDGLLMRTKMDDWDKTIDINLKGAFLCSKVASKSMMKARWGRIINISSIIGESGNAGQVAYSASKAGLLGMTKSLAKELASRNITVNAITPGYITTDMTANITDEMKEKMFQSIPLGRLGNTKDISNLVSFLSTPLSDYITGQVIGVNGGMYM